MPLFHGKGEIVDVARTVRGTGTLLVKVSQRLDRVYIVGREARGGFQFRHSLGESQEAAELRREAIAILAAQPRPDGTRLAALHDELGVDLMLLDQHDEAEAELRGALSARQELLGDDHPAVAASLLHLGELLGVQRGNFDAAEPLLAESVRIRRGAGEEGRLELADSLNAFGRCSSRLRRHEAAVAALGEALAPHRAALGADHPMVADDLNGLGNAISRAGRPQDAEPLQRQALALRHELFGEPHGAVAQSLVSLGVVLEQQGKLEEAAQVFARAVSTYRQLFGPDHQAVVISTTLLADVELQRGELHHALELFRAALAATGRSPTSTPRERFRASLGVGSTLRELERFNEAAPVLQAALEQAQRLPSDRVFEIAHAQLEVGRLELARGRLAAAEALLAAAEQSYRQVLPDLRESACAALWLGVCRARLGRSAEAQALLRAASETLGRIVPPAYPDCRRAEEELRRLKQR